ncbi:MAG TPA: glycosyltransferase [Acidimicrobiia bacterium]|nr:glycosyltransferase [Acidimicrobiia bacterium]
MSVPVSIVMPARNARATVAASVQAALSQDYSGTIEVIVAEGGSIDDTRHILENLAASEPRFRLVDNPAGTTPAGLNRAIAAATGEIIVRCDAHAVLPPEYVATAVRMLAETGADNVGGVQRARGVTLLEKAIALAMSTPLGAGDARYRLGGPPGPTDTVYLGTFRRAALERVGGFDETLERNQDYELNIRLRQTGGTVFFHPDLVVDYRPRGSFSDLWRQYLDYGRWKREVIRRHPGSVRWRQLAAPLLVVGLGVSLVLGLAGAAIGLALPLAYTGILLAGAGWVAAVRRSLAALLLPPVVAVMHLAWGLGFLQGLPSRRRFDKTPPL